MQPAASVGFGIAFTAGLLSFLSPCVLPLIPSYVTFVTGMSLDDVQRSRRAVLTHALLFTAGFTLTFLALGATATMMGRVLLAYRDWVSRIGGALIIVFGLYMLGVFNIRLFGQEKRVHLARKPVGYLGTALVGVAFGAGWTPCIGPILGAVLLYTSTSADLGRGLLLLLAYSLGLAIPFICAALAMSRFLGGLARFRTHMVWVMRSAGVLLITVGVLMALNDFSRLASSLQGLTPAMLRERL
jgi:cytochrome c-type biogenesis protein